MKNKKVLLKRSNDAQWFDGTFLNQIFVFGGWVGGYDALPINYISNIKNLWLYMAVLSDKRAQASVFS